LNRAIDSVLLQEYPPDELIIVDDGSDDETWEMLRVNYGNRIIRIRQPNRGVSAARNIGIRRAGGHYLAFLDSDDWWHPRKLLEQLRVLDEHPEIRIAYTNEIWLLNGRPINQHKHHQKFSGDMFYRSLNLCLISPSSILIDRGVLEQVGLFDETMPVCEDYDLWLRITCRYPVWFDPKPLVYKRGGHGDQLSKQLPVMDYYRILSLDRLLDSGLLNPEQHQAALSILTQKLRIVRTGSVKHHNQTMLGQISPIMQRHAIDMEIVLDRSKKQKG